MLFLHDIYHIIGMEQDNLYNLLQSIDTPDDLRHLSADKLPEVCKELRQKIIDELSCNPGHFGSSLGVIELTVALHYVFNTPYDRIVWDVGHQAYGHKILTGRRDAFCTNRRVIIAEERPCRMASAAPKQAPVEAPSRSGAAIGFWKTPW